MPNCPVAFGTGKPSEARRLDALLDYDILDTAVDARFERVVALACELWDVPMAAISLVDDERQWFKSRIGLEASETPRAWAFCDRTIRGDAVLVVEDARDDERFASSPLVTAAPRLRFYAGAPLTAPDGERLGALCLMDRRPRSFPVAQRAQLARLAETVVDLMGAHRTQRLLERKERLLALAELSQMEQIRYGRIFEASLNEIYLFDAASLRLVAANRGARENLGYREAELRAMTPLDLMPEVAREHFERLLEPLRSGRRERVAFEREQRRKDGSRYPAEVALELDGHGERPLFVAVVQDLTEKRAYQRELARALALVQSILDACQDAIETFTPLFGAEGEIVDFRCLQANAAARRLHGLGAGQPAGQTLLGLWPAWRDSELLELFRGVVARREPLTTELRYVDARRDGWYRVSAAATGDGDLTLEIIDVSERKLRERALQRSNEALDQFAAGIAHDLQTPIGQIAGFAVLLERHLGETVPPKAREALGYIAQAADNMSRLVGSLLDYARLGTLTVDPEPVELREVVEQCLAELADELALAEVRVGALPQVPGNATLLRQVFQNLVGNALKYRSERPLRLSIGAERQGATLRIAVEDNGIGIAPRHAERIFEVFRRLHADGSPYPGLGMGLALTKTIVEAHGGRIWLDTEPRPEGGSRFLLELPLSAAGRAPASHRRRDTAA